MNSFLAHIAQTIFASMFPFYSYATETLISTLNKTNSSPCFSPSFFFNRKNEISIPTIYINEKIKKFPDGRAVIVEHRLQRKSSALRDRITL